MRIFMNSLNLIQGCKVVEQIINPINKKFALLVEMNNSEIQFNSSKICFFLEHEIDVDVEIQTFDSQFFGVMRNTILKLITSQS